MKLTLYWPDEDRRLLADLKWLAKARGESLSLMLRKLAQQELTGGKDDEAQT